MSEASKTTGETQIQIVLSTLLDVANDKSPLVHDTIKTALRKLAKKHPNEVLKACCDFGKQNNAKANAEHLALILQIMEDICKEHIVEINGDVVLIIIDFCIDLMTNNSHVEPDIQIATSNVLVAIGCKHGIQVVDGLMEKLSTGNIPHYVIPHTLGSLASTNAYGVVPYLTKILEILLPLVNNLKQDHIKQSFAYSFGRFCEAILEYTSNPEQAPDPSIEVKDFHLEMCSAFDILFNSWLNSKETKLVQTVLYALSPMFSTLGEEKIRQVAVKCILTFLNLLKKHKETHAIIKCISSVLSISSAIDGTLLEPHLQQILPSLSELICISPDYAQPELLRTHSEILRSFECLCNHYTDNTLDHILMLLKHHGEKERSKGLIIVTHLINTVEVAIKSRLQDILSAMETMLSDSSIKVKQSLMKTIVSFAYKGLLKDSDARTEKLIQFMVKLCCRQPVFTPSEQQDASCLKQTADNTLYLLTTSANGWENTLWNILLKCFLNTDYNDALVTVLRCMTYLASKKEQKEPCVKAFVRCLGLMALPLGNFRGTFILNFFRHISVWKSQECALFWDTNVPHLLKYLEENFDCFNVAEWEELVFDFLSSLLTTVKDKTFDEGLITCINDQLPLYGIKTLEVDGSLKNAEKSFLFKCLAIISCHLSDKSLVIRVLDIILRSVKLNDINELQACAQAVGFASRNNLKAVLEKLAIIRKDVILKKSNKFFNFGFMKGQKHELEMERIRYVVIASYVSICHEAPANNLFPIIESEILDFVVNELSTCRDFTIRRICLQAIGAVADALHPTRNKLHIRLQDRDKILQIVSAELQLHSGPEYIELFPIIIPVMNSLIKLPNILESNQRLRLLKLCFDNIFNASAIYCKLNNDSHGDVKLAPHVFASFAKLNLLVEEILLQNVSPATLDEIFTLLEPWFGRKKLEQRFPSLQTLRKTLETYLEHMQFIYEGPNTFGQTGIILGKVVPRCTDPDKKIRRIAVECVGLTLSISARYEGHLKEKDKILSNSLSHVLQDIATEDPKLLFHLVTDMASVVASNIPKYQLGHLVDTLIDGLTDIEPSSSSGAAVTLNAIVKSNGKDLQPFLNEFMERLLNVLDKVKCSRTKSTAILTMLSLAKHHTKPVINFVLQQPLPYNQSTCSCWSVLSSDTMLVTEMFEQLKYLLKQDIANVQLGSLKSLQCICAFQEILRSKETHEICNKQFAELFALFYISVASHVNGDSSNLVLSKETTPKLAPFKLCVDTFKLFLQNANCKDCASKLLVAKDSMGSFLGLIPELTDSLCNERPHQSLSWLVASLGPFVRSDFDAHRVAVTGMFAYFLKFRKSSLELVLAENILELLLDIQEDRSCVVRKLCIRGLRFAAEFLNAELVQRYSANILSAIMQGLDYSKSSESEVALEAMLSFSQLLKVANNGKLGQTQVTAAVRIKPLLQHESNEIRDAAFSLFGDLAVSIGPDDAFLEQIQGNLITLLLHLCDVDSNVVKACKRTLRKVTPFLQAEKVNTLVQEHLLEEGNLHLNQFYMDFIKTMAETMQEHFPQLILFCLGSFKSQWTDIRANSAFLAGFIYSQTGEDFKPQISLDTLSYRLLQLLKDEEADVRAKAAQSLAYVFTSS